MNTLDEDGEHEIQDNYKKKEIYKRGNGGNSSYFDCFSNFQFMFFRIYTF